MRQLLLCLTIALLFLESHSQTVTPVIITSDGGYSQSVGGSITWAIGEPVSEMYTTPTNITSMGFLQPEIDLETFLSEQGDENGILVYPNPVRESLHINFKGTLVGSYSIELYDIAGKLILKQNAYITALNKALNLNVNEIAEATYLLKISNRDFNRTLKISKTN